MPSFAPLPATIGPNRVFYDNNGNGIKGTNETFLVNVHVDVFCYVNGAPLLVRTNVTNSNGEYVIYDILPGAGFVQLSPKVNNKTYSFSLIVPTGKCDL